MYDCEGYVTRYGVKCTDGVTISQGAFADQNGARVPVVWMHIHDDVEAVLGHADLEARDERFLSMALRLALPQRNL